MISFSDSIQNDSSKWKDCATEELFSDFSVPTSTPIANVNNNQSKQTLFFSLFSLSLSLSVVHLSSSVTKFGV